MNDKTKNSDKIKDSEQPSVDRRSSDLEPDFVNRRKANRRKEDIEIDFEDRRKCQRRAKVLGVDFEDRRDQETNKD